MTVDNSYLVGLFTSSSASTSTNLFSALYAGMTSTASPNDATTPAAPTPPWQAGAKAPSVSALVQGVLNGQKFINPSSAQLDVTGAKPAVNQDYKNLFALYQGLDALYGLTQQASSATGLLQASQLKQAFKSGMSQVSAFLQGNNFQSLHLVQGSVTTQETSSASVHGASSTYVGQNIVSGSSGADAPAFDGTVQFSLTATAASGTPTTVNFDLSEMGSTTRSLANVVTYLNGKLKAAGLVTRFATQRTAGQAQTEKINGQTVTLSTSPDQYALVLNESPAEVVTLAAPATADAVYVAQGSGAPSSSGQASGGQQILKFQAGADAGGTPPAALAQPGDTHVTPGEAWQDNLPSSVTGVQRTATAADGSVYVLADISGTTGGQTIKGPNDVALLKYDAAGKLQFTQTLGAAQGATGLGLAVSADGKVAVTGQVTGSLNPGDGLTAGSQSGFVSVYNANGDELWSQTLAADAGAQANAVTFGANDTVYVAGQTSSAILGAGGETGGTDAFVAGYSATGVNQFTTQYGTTGVDKATSLVVDGNSLIVGGVENGDAVLRNFQLQATGKPTLTATRDLGFLAGGSVAGVALVNGQVIVAGTTHNHELAAGTTTAAWGNGANAYVASLDPSLNPNPSDSVAYYQAQGDTTVSAVTVVNGAVYVAGQTGPTITPGGSTANPPPSGQAGYIAQIDPVTGQVGFTTQLSGANGIATPTSISASSGGANVLDRLGLPTGTISQAAPSTLLTTATSVRAGDSFYVQGIAGQPPTKVTVAANDTWSTLAAKVAQASNFRLTATVSATTNKTLNLKAAFPDASVQILAGPAGQDALSALGLTPGLIQPNQSSSSGSASSSSSQPPAFGLSLPANLDLNNAADIKHAAAVLQVAMSAVKGAYQGLVAANKPKSAQTATTSGPVPAYLTSQIANYTAALQRLTGG